MHRFSWLLLAACASEGVPTPPENDAFSRVWTDSIRSGDLIIGVPGTGGYDTLGAYIEAPFDPAHPEVLVDFDGRAYVGSIEVLEGAIAAAERAGFTPDALEAGEVTLALWGAGITKIDAFRYHSLEGLDVRFEVLGGISKCATGSIPANLLNYNRGNAEADASDLHQRTGVWLAAHPLAGRKVTLVSHSWGGVVAEYASKFTAQLAAQYGAWPDAELVFSIAGGVPGFIPDFPTLGAGFRTVESTEGDQHAAVRAYEVNRPDDPVNTFDPQGNGGGHHYVIMIGEDYRGWYGITTDELACAGVAGQCPARE
ncbi:MAG: hypothetical protein ABI867_15050 [Kofleriaceae bacterium]